ncbi:MAG: tetratricopeptide repeat protein [Planctomycetes bacterium]|jgi:type VI secretion system protein ImpE|nr:tetratricopeptide repeat protein [Planctomycetota bacterium]
MDAWKSLAAEKSLLAGDLDGALAKLTEKVRGDPANPKLRVFLFQILCLNGEWDRAITQLNVAAEMDPINLTMAQVYREAIQCEVLRTSIFAGRTSPLVFGDPEPWIALLLEALRATAEGRHEHARDLRDQAFDTAPTTSGKIDSATFSWIADGDSRLGPVLEAIVLGRYYWIPFSRIREIRMEPPTDLRDFVWAPTQFTWSNGGQTVGLIPARYPGSEAHAEPAIRLGKRTEWADVGAGTFVGLGQRMLATDVAEHPLLDVRSALLDTIHDPTGEEPPQGTNG